MVIKNIRLMNILFPMAGRGTRTLSYGEVKPLIKIKMKPMIQWAIESLNIDGQYIFITRDYENDEWNNELTELLNIIVPDAIIHRINYITDGPACSALLAKEDINNDVSLLITNSDQIFEWDSKDFEHSLERNDIDGLVSTWDKIAETESFIELNEDGYGVRLIEKEIISDHPLNGLHFWKKGKYFVKSAEDMIADNKRSGNGEFYISETYNYMIKDGYKIGTYPMTSKQHWPVGISSDIDKYLNR